MNLIAVQVERELDEEAKEFRACLSNGTWSEWQSTIGNRLWCRNIANIDDCKGSCTWYKCAPGFNKCFPEGTSEYVACATPTPDAYVVGNCLWGKRTCPVGMKSSTDCGSECRSPYAVCCEAEDGKNQCSVGRRECDESSQKYRFCLSTGVWSEYRDCSSAELCNNGMCSLDHLLEDRSLRISDFTRLAGDSYDSFLSQPCGKQGARAHISVADSSSGVVRACWVRCFQNNWYEERCYEYKEPPDYSSYVYCDGDERVLISPLTQKLIERKQCDFGCDPASMSCFVRVGGSCNSYDIKTENGRKATIHYPEVIQQYGLSLICDEGVWRRVMSQGKPVDVSFDESCTADEVANHLKTIDLLETSLPFEPGLKIYCVAGGEAQRFDNDGNLLRVGLGGTLTSDKNGQMILSGDVQSTMLHEIGHAVDYNNLDMRKNFIETTGCSVDPSNPDKYIMNEEINIINIYNCKEAFADAYKEYVLNACEMKEKHPIQFNFLKDNVFNSKEFCQN